MRCILIAVLASLTLVASPELHAQRPTVSPAVRLFVVVDTRSTASSIGLMATACAKARRAGRSLDETAALAKAIAT